MAGNAKFVFFSIAVVTLCYTCLFQFWPLFFEACGLFKCLVVTDPPDSRSSGSSGLAASFFVALLGVGQAVPSICMCFFFFFLKLALVSGYIFNIFYFLHLLIFCLEMIFCGYQKDAGQHHSLGVGFKHCFFKNSSEFLEGLLPKKLRCPLKNNAWKTIRLPFESWPLSLGTFVCFLECSQPDKDALMFLPQSRVPTSYRPLGNLTACHHRSEILEKRNKVSSRI